MKDIELHDDIEERDAEYARRVKREVVLMQSVEPDREYNREYNREDDGEYDRESDGEYDREDDGEADSDVSPAEEAASSSASKTSLVWLLLSGNILLKRSLTKYYGQMVVVAGLFLLRIVVMFWSLHLDMSHEHLQRDVQLLRERSVRLQEERFDRCSHSSIVKELERREIDIVDPVAPAIVMEDGFWKRVMR